MTEPIVLSYVQIAPLLAARKAGQMRATISPDLGLSTVEIVLEAEGARFPVGELLAWDDAEVMLDEENKCFVLQNDTIDEIRIFSEHTHWVRSLMPTTGAPTMLVSGTPMHRIKGIDPHADTLRKVKTIAPMTGRVLDTATGLGYTAIEAAKTASEVVTIELDPAGLEIARHNPWSRQLFSDRKIVQLLGDAFDVVEGFADESFSRILHDPPMFSLAGHLYGGEFYRQLFRVLKRKGRLFHYIGDLESTSGRNITRGVMRRLQESGFTRVIRHPEAFGVVALK
ncbi:MAG: methyltransferase domain-containing protein [Chloroflexi bacterium]|nr:methyltransferase domain-containing protein [Chloroflexota bacterium]